ncbi:MAG: hypothetical protein ABI609_17595 [Acidobacteriota bacterium]
MSDSVAARTRTLSTACLLVCLVACSSPAPEAPPPKVARQESLLKVAAKDLPAVVRARYRVQPDRRLLAAVGALYQLSTGKPAATVQVTFDRDHWIVLLGTESVGTLPELPSFDDATRLLRGLDASLNGRRESTGEVAAGAWHSGEVEPERILSTLTSLNQAFGANRHDRELMRSAADGFVWLGLVADDSLDQATVLYGRAWALVTLESSIGSVDSAAHEALLTSVLGYETAALSIAARLDTDHPVRLYVSRDKAGLERVCSAHADDGRCAFLRLALLADRGDAEVFRRELHASVFGRDSSLTGLALAALKADFNGGPGVGHNLAKGAMQRTRPGGFLARLRSLRPVRSAVEAQTKAFERDVHDFALGLQGELVDSPSIEGFYRALFYSGLYGEAYFYTDRLSAVPATEQFSKALADPAAGTATELKRWCELRAHVLSGSMDLAPLSDAIKTMESVGVGPLERMRYTVASVSASTDPLRRISMPALFRQLDSRPWHLMVAARAAGRNLTSRPLFDQFARAAVSAAPYDSGDLLPTVAVLTEDSARLRTIAEDSSLRDNTRWWALAWLKTLGGVDDAFLRERYRAMAAAAPSGPAVDALIDNLKQAGDLDGALEALAEILRLEKPDHFLDLSWAHLVTRKAGLLAAQGHLDAALEALKPGLRAGTEEALETGASLELRRGHLDEGLKLAMECADRYPDAEDASALIVRALWMKHDVAGATKEVAGNKRGLVRDWTVLLPNTFAEVFETSPEAAAREAFEALERAGVAPHILADLALALGKKGDLEAALRLLARLHDPQPEWDSQIRIETYDLLREKKGEAKALEWMRQVVPVPDNALSLTLYQSRHYELLWGLYPPGAEGPKPEVLRLLKAASLLHLKERSSARRAQLLDELESVPEPKEFYVQAALFLLGKRSEEVVLGPYPEGDADAATVGWLMGLKAADDGHFQIAEPWFQVALESHLQMQPPHAWSFVILADWYSKTRSLEILEGKGEF